MVETRRKRAALAVGTDDLDSEIARARQRLTAEGALKLSALKGSLRDAVCERLVADGFELGATCVRQPLAAQLHAASSREEAIAVSELPERVRGASRAELAQALDAQVARGELRRIQRGRSEYVVGARHAVLGERRLGALRGTLSDLAKMLEAASKKKNVGLLASDIGQMLSAAQRVLEEDSAPRPPEEVAADEAATAPAPAVATRSPAAAKGIEALPEVDPLAELLSVLDGVRDAHNGMSFVPAIVRRLSTVMSVPEALELLMRAARLELIELRPEGGLGRLSDEELMLCPPGPAGTRLSWARRSAGVSA